MTPSSEYILERSTILPTGIDNAWSFFSDPKNLAFITPPEMQFRIQSELKPGDFKSGLQIQYTVSPLAGIPLKWVSKITDLERGKFFVDEQVRGPYKSWRHRHDFEPCPGGVLMRDVVKYQMPFGFLGKICHLLFVKKKLVRIFEYREQKIRFLFQ